MLELFPSAIDGYLSCGHAYYLKFILKETAARTLPALVGSCLHKCLSMDATAYKETRQFLAQEHIKEAGYAYLRKLMADAPDVDLKGEPPELAYQDAREYLEKLLNQYLYQVRNKVEYDPTSTEMGLQGVFSCSGVQVAVRARLDIFCAPNTMWEYKAKKAQGRYYTGKNEGNIQVNTCLMLLEAAGIKEPVASFAFIKPNKVHISKVTLNARSRTRTALLIGKAAEGIQKGIFLPAVQDETKSFVCEYCDYNRKCCYTLYKNKLQGGLDSDRD